ncbi:flippase [candidate division KSB1 bacterium]|nr:flippase [candidate division KSB1 bacterium]
MDQARFTPGGVLAKNTLLNLIGMFLPLIVGVVAIPFAIKGLGTEGFGAFSVIWIILGYFGMLDFGLSKATTKFVAEILGRREVQGLPSIVWTASIISVVFGIVGTAILFIITPYLVDSLLKIPINYINQTKLSFYLSACALPIILFSTSLRGVLGAAQRFDLVNLVLIPVSILSFIYPALSYPFNLNLSTVVLLIILTRVVGTFFYLLFCFRVFPILKTRPIVDWEILKKLLSYGGWITITSVVSPILVYMDRFFIGSILAISAVAFYSAPYEIINRIRILPIAVMKTFFPEFSALSQRDENNRVEMLFGRSVKYILLPTGTVALVLFFFAPEILQLWLGTQFAEKATTVFRILALGIVINSLAFIPFNLLQSVGKPDLPAKFHLFEFPFYIILLWLLTKNFGINGAATAWFIRVTFDFLLLYAATVKYYPAAIKALRKNRIGLELLFLTILFFFLLLTGILVESILSEVILLVLFLLLFGIMVWYLIFDSKERQLINSGIRRFITSDTTESAI